MTIATMGSGERRRVLLVAMVDSVHVGRWIAQFDDDAIDFVLFPSTPNRRVHRLIRERLRPQPGRVARTAFPRWLRALSLVTGMLDLVAGQRIKGFLLRHWAQRHRFDVIHVMEFQHAGYIALRAWPEAAPAPMIATNWGSDIFWFQRFPNHRAKIVRLLGIADAYSAECKRDVRLAQALGFTGVVLPVVPNAGGIEHRHSTHVPPSSRRTIAVKGYDRFVGEAGVALDAITSISDVLVGYNVVVYSASWRIRRRVRRIKREHSIDITALRPHGLSHAAMVELFSSSRVYLGISRSDGISTSLLESMWCGCFPIQTATSCANEWVADGETAFLIEQIDAGHIASRLREALDDDAMVDRAALVNRETASGRLGQAKVATVARSFYETVLRSVPASA